MRTFEFHFTQINGGGIMLVAAENEDDAIDFAKAKNRYWELVAERYDIKYIGLAKSPIIMIDYFFTDPN